MSAKKANYTAKILIAFKAAQGMDFSRLVQKHIANERNLSRCDFAKTKLPDAEFSQMNLSYIDLSRASLHGANLSKANLSHANLHGADLCDANLSDTDLTGADLRCALLIRANLEGAKLDGTDLRWASLAYVTPSDIDLSRARISRTVLPEGSPSDS